MNKCVWVVINTELGWDNIVAVFDQEDVSFEQLLEIFPEGESYYIDDRVIEKDLEDYELD